MLCWNNAGSISIGWNEAIEAAMTFRSVGFFYAAAPIGELMILQTHNKLRR